MAFALSRNERCYVQLESTYGTIPNTAGTADLGNDDAFRHVRFQCMNDVQVIDRPDKTGTRSQTVGTAGRKFARFALEMGLSAYGSAGDKPRVDPLLEALFGKAGTVVASTSVTYDLDDAMPSVSIWSFRTPAAVSQRVVHGGVISNATFNLGQDAATWAVEGEGQWMLQDDYFSVADATQKGGLTSFPTEPAAPNPADAGLTIGFTGAVTMGGNSMATIRQAVIRVFTGNESVKDTFNEFYPTTTQGAERRVTIAFSCYDDDSTGIYDLREAANDKTAVDMIIQVGTTAGNIWTFNLESVLLAPEQLNDNQLRYASDYGDSRAHASGVTSLDEVQLVLT